MNSGVMQNIAQLLQQKQSPQMLSPGPAAPQGQIPMQQSQPGVMQNMQSDPRMMPRQPMRAF